MLRLWIGFLIVVSMVVGPSSGRAMAQDDVIVRGRKLSDWFKLIREDKDARRRLAALQLVESETGPKISAVFPALAKELKEHPDPAIRIRIASLLPRYKERGDEVTVVLKQTLATDKVPAVRESCALALGQLDQVGFTAVRELTDALKDPHGPTRAAAAQSLGRFSRLDGEIAKDALTALAEMLKDTERSARLSAAFALGRMEAGASPVVPAMSAALAVEKDPAVRKELMKSLAGLGARASDAAPVLLAALKDPSAEIRQSAAVALGKIAPDAAQALPELIKAARDSDKSVRCHAVRALGSLGKEALPAIPDLIDILKKDDVVEVRLAVIVELGGFGPDAKAAIDVLTVASRDGRPSVRDAAQDALKKIQSMP